MQAPKGRDAPGGRSPWRATGYRADGGRRGAARGLRCPRGCALDFCGERLYFCRCGSSVFCAARRTRC